MDKDPQIDYRFMTRDDAEVVCALVARVFNTYVAPDYAPDGAVEFLRFVRPDVMRKRLRKNYFGLVALAGAQMVGMIEMKDYCHISLLFVEGAFQRRGIGKALWERALAHCQAQEPDLKDVTVNSARSAIPVYERFGFVPIGPEETRSGIQFTPMLFTLE